MADLVREYLDSWHEGVVSSQEVSWPPGSVNQIGIDQLQGNASPRAWNNAFAITGTRAAARKRDGCVTLNATPVTGAPAINGMFAYRFRDTATGTIAQYHLLVSDNGRLDWTDESGTLTSIDTAAVTFGFPDFAVLNNLCFIANGFERFKLYGTSKQNFGITRPTNNATGTSGVAGSLNGVYEVAFTFVNSVTGHESSRSNATAEITALAQTIDLSNIPTSTDSQVDEVNIYIRNIASQTEFYLIDTIAEGTTTATIDVDPGTTDADLTTLSPSINSHNPPPEGIKFLAAHKNRLFAADDTTLYWSETGKPEAFDPDAFDFVNKDDGQKIRGLLSTPGGELLIFKEDGYYTLEGDTPGIWAISRRGPAVGCESHRSIKLGVDGIYWWAEQGPVRMEFGSYDRPELIGANRISAVLSRAHVNLNERLRICAAFDITNQRILFSVPEPGQFRNTKTLVWNSRLRVWESDRWDPIDIASFAEVNDAEGQPFVMGGGYAGQVFKLGVGNNDGVPSGTMTGTFVASATTHSTITDLTAAFHTSGGKLIERKVTVLDSNGLTVSSVPRPRIVTNTATALTLNTAVSGLTSGSTYTYIVGGPDWQFDTAWRDLGAPFDKKRVEFNYFLGLLYGNNCYVDILSNKRNSTLLVERFALINGEAALWNQFNWNDGTLWNEADVTYDRIRVGRTGTTFAFRYRNPFANQPMLLLKAGLRAVTIDDKLG